MKVVSVNFWLIFDRDNEMVESSPQPHPVTKNFLEKVKGNQGKIVVCANDQEETAKIEGRQPWY
jgi:predicted HAD superfamily phosphohydrolase YqeG